MPISRYPRPGHPLAPKALKSVLTARIPKKFVEGATGNIVELCDLDASAWEKLSREICRQLGKAIVEAVRTAKLTNAMLDMTLPPVPSGSSLEHLELEQRTYNCLCKMQLDGLLAGPEDLGKRTIRELLEVEHFGAKSLVDLLTSLEAAGSPTNGDGNQEPRSKEPVALSEGTLTAAFVGRFRNLRLPRLPARTSLSDLHLARRTYNCLDKHGFTSRIATLASLTLGEVMQIPGFGMQCLVDYLDAVDRIRNGKEEKFPKASAPVELYAELDLHPYLEDELRDLMQRCFRKRGIELRTTTRNIEIVIAHYGCDGGGGATFRELGDRFHVTKQRAMQICDKSTERLKRLRSLPSRLKAALDMISRHLPSDCESLEILLQKEGLTRNHFKVQGLLRICKLLGQVPPFELEDVEGRQMVVHPGKIRMTKRTIFQARREVSRFGVATVLELAAMLSERLSTKITAEFVTRVLGTQLGLEWLDRDSGWFWLRNLRNNRVVSRVRKILSVSGRIEVGELRTGIARHHAMGGYAPPRKVLLELCKQLPYCAVDGVFVRAEPPIDWKSTLRGAELLLVSVLKEHGPLLQRANFEKLCLSMGMKRSTFYAYLSYSPVVERYAYGVYGIRGANIEPGIVESLIPHNPRMTSVRLDHGWTRDRRIWIGYCLSEGMLGNGAFSVPSGLKQFLQGSFALKSVDGALIGTVVVRDNAGWGLGTLFRRRGGDPGDTLLLIFDAKGQNVIASIGDESQLDQFESVGVEGPHTPI